MDFRKWLEQTQPQAQPVAAQENPQTQQTMNVVEKYLQDLENEGYQLFAHQTAKDIAYRIISQGQDFGGGGVLTTVKAASPSGIRQAITDMQAGKAAAGGTSGVHRGADAILIMVAPAKIKNAYEFTEYLAELGLDYIPHNQIAGAWLKDGDFWSNKNRFNPSMN
jgi:hypothetical protein